MKTIYPTVYKDFHCRAAACDHSCCKGWEIDIDPETARRYLDAPPPLGDRLRGAIAFDGETHSFRLTEDERCPSLNKSGLCDIITEWGENALCDICREHPRFYETVGDYELQGLGLACEEFEHARLFCAEANVRARIPHVLKLMEKCGFRQTELLMRYPGVDINPQEK